jgi:triacylglycerol lipase
MLATAVAAILFSVNIPAIADNDLAGPAHTEIDEAQFLPDPTGDPYLDQKFPVTNAMPNGTILSSRPINADISVPLPGGGGGDVRAWQAWYKTTAGDGSPSATIVTVLKPARWNGGIIANNFAIDGLGTRCNPSYQMTHGDFTEIPPVGPTLLSRGYALVISDYEGPRMAYAHGPTEGRAVLDGIRAALRLPAANLSGPVALLGYSGGGIATVWAAQLAPTYAPDLHLIGAAPGGAPTDLDQLRPPMDGKFGASGFYLSGALGLARATPGALQQLNPIGAELARQFRNSCVSTAMAAGAVPIKLTALTDGSLYKTDLADRIFQDTTPGQLTPNIPIFFWHGAEDEFIPISGVEKLSAEWAARGVNSTVDVLHCGEHVTCAMAPEGMQAIDRWMAAAGISTTR